MPPKDNRRQRDETKQPGSKDHPIDIDDDREYIDVDEVEPPVYIDVDETENMGSLVDIDPFIQSRRNNNNNESITLAQKKPETPQLQGSLLEEHVTRQEGPRSKYYVSPEELDDALEEEEDESSSEDEDEEDETSSEDEEEEEDDPEVVQTLVQHISHLVREYYRISRPSNHDQAALQRQIQTTGIGRNWTTLIHMIDNNPMSINQVVELMIPGGSARDLEYRAKINEILDKLSDKLMVKVLQGVVAFINNDIQKINKYIYQVNDDDWV